MTVQKCFYFLCIIFLFTYLKLTAQTIAYSNKSLFTQGESHWFKRNLPEAAFYLSTYIAKEKKPTDHNDFVNANDLLANIFITKSEYDSALYFSSAAFAAIQQISNKRLLPNLYQTKARIYNQLGDLENTIQYFSIADSLYAASEEQVLKEQGVYTATALGSIFQEQQQNDKAKEYYEKAIERAQLWDAIYPLILSLESLAGLYIQTKEYKKALDIFYTKIYPATYANKNSNANSMLMYSWLDMGDIHNNLSNTDSASYYYNKAIKQMYLEKELYKIDVAYVRLATLYFKTGNTPAAKVFCDSTFVWAYRNNNPKQVITCYQLLCEIAIREKQFEKAVVYLQKKAQCSDSLLNTKNLELSNKFYILNKVKEKDVSIASLSEKNRINEQLIEEREIVNYLLAGLIILLPLLSIIFFNRLKLKNNWNSI